MVEEAVAMVVVVVGMVEASAILVALPAMAPQLTKERILQRTVGTEVTTGMEVATGAEVPIGAGTAIPIRLIIRTTAMITTITATLPFHYPPHLQTPPHRHHLCHPYYPSLLTYP